jgi:hypothetical protein
LTAVTRGLVGASLLATALLVAPAPGFAADPERGVLDAREDATTRVPAAVRSARKQLRHRLGPQGLVAVDSRTGATRTVAKLDGFLTPQSARGGGEIAKDYIRDHATAFGLDAQDLAALQLTRRYVSGSGIEHIVWAQTYRGIPSVDSALRANVSASGRLLNVLGPAQPDLSVPSTTPELSAGQAAAAAARAVGARPQGATGRESLVIYRSGTANRLAWRVLTFASSTEVYDSIVDATTGAVVRRTNRVSFASALAHDHYPGAPAGGTASLRTLPAAWLETTTRLRGPFAHAFSDVNDVVPGPQGTNFTPSGGSEVEPSAGDSWDYPRQAFSYAGGSCPAAGCAWNHTTPDSWTTNRAQATTQLFWFVNNFRDHLAAAPIGFTAASGGFEGADRVLAQTDDGANLVSGGLPDADHANNANMTTLQDGTPGLMQMYVWQPPFRAINGADDGTIVYHEYTHGLSNRLITDPQGFGAVWTNQAAAMGEGWSDWYAMDFLAAPRSGPASVTDTAAQGEIGLGDHLDTATTRLRFEALDCAVGNATNCPGTAGAGSGGFTYGDFGNVFGVPEVHADGEIWGQTLWQLRQALIAAHGEGAGVERARRYITDAMRLSPDNPTFLDMRNAILQANTNAGGGDRDLIWAVFASRGMGYFASTSGGNDAAPIESFALPPAPGGPTGTVQGTVYDDTGTTQSGAKVAFAGHDTGLGEDLSAQSGAGGTYAIAGVPVGTYPLLYAQPAAAGFVRATATDVVVAAGTNTRDWTVRRNLAAAALGAAITSFTGSDASSVGCGPGALIDGNQAIVWGSESPRHPMSSGPKEIVVRLANPADVAAIRVDPAAGCGDGVESSLGQYAMDVSTSTASPPPAGSFTQVAAGTFGRANNWRMNDLALTGSTAGVTHVRLRAIDTQAANASDKDFMDVSELQVFGPVTPPPPPPPPPPDPQPPVVVTGAATQITRSGARLAGTVNPNGSATTYHFEYGTSTAYGRRTPDVSAGGGGAAVAVAATVGGLSAATTYHYRLVASNPKTAAGANRTFKTLRSARPLTILAASTIRVPSSGRFSFRVRYAQGVRRRPAARVTVTAPRRIASAALRVIPSRRVTAKVRLTRSGRALLRRKRKLRATLRVAVTTTAGKRVTVTKRVQLAARR